MIRLLLVEDHVLVRQSMRAFLTGAGLEVIGEASTGHEAIQMAQDLQPHLVLMDIHLPEMSGIEATRQIRRHHRHIRVVALTAYNEKIYQRALKDAGADAFVLKTAEFSELLATLHRVISTPINELVTPPSQQKPTDTASSLTERETEVLTYIGRGWANKQIGRHLGISDRTVQVHLQTIYQKFDVTSRTEAVLRAIVMGMISPMDGTSE